MKQPNPYATYEDAARDYAAKYRALMQLPKDAGITPDLRGVELPVEILIQHASEIARISSCMIQLAQSQLDAANAKVCEGIQLHFVDQATAEFLLGTELLRICSKETGMPSPAADLATYSAALREGAGAAEKSSSLSLAEGIPTGEPYRAMEYSTADEAAAALELAIANTLSNITRRVQELGKDIAYDLVAGTPWAGKNGEEPLSGKDIAALLESIPGNYKKTCPGVMGAAAGNLVNAYHKIQLLLDRSAESAARQQIWEWLAQMQQTGRTDAFDGMIEALFDVEGLKKNVNIGTNISRFELESINRTFALLKSLSERFTLLAGRMKKLEDAIRLGKLIHVPQILKIIAALQFALLTALVYSGYDYINNGLAGILRARGLWLPSANTIS